MKSTRSPKFTVLVYLIQVQYIWLNHIYKLFQEYSTIDPPDLSPGSSPWDTNRTNRTRSSGGKYESALFLTPPLLYYSMQVWRVHGSHSTANGFLDGLKKIFSPATVKHFLFQLLKISDRKIFADRVLINHPC